MFGQPSWLPGGRERPHEEHEIRIRGAHQQGRLILLTAIMVAVEGFDHWARPQEMRSALVLAVALLGLGANLLQIWLLSRSQKNKTSGILRLHLVSDLLTSCGVIGAAVLTRATGLLWLDPLFAVLIALYIFWCGVNVLVHAEQPHHH